MANTYYAAAVHRSSEAFRWLTNAEGMLAKQDFSGCRTCAVRARSIDPRLSRTVNDIVIIADTLLAGQRRTVTNQHDWYAILGMSPAQGRDPQLVSSHYYSLIHILNPQRNRFPFADRAIHLICNAWAVLSDPIRKSIYDSEHGLNGQPQLPPVNDPVVALHLNHGHGSFPQAVPLHGISTTSINYAPQQWVAGGSTRLTQQTLNSTANANLLLGPAGFPTIGGVSHAQQPAFVGGSTRLSQPIMGSTYFGASPTAAPVQAQQQMVGGSTQLPQPFMGSTAVMTYSVAAPAPVQPQQPAFVGGLTRLPQPVMGSIAGMTYSIAAPAPVQAQQQQVVAGSTREPEPTTCTSAYDNLLFGPELTEEDMKPLSEILNLMRQESSSDSAGTVVSAPMENHQQLPVLENQPLLNYSTEKAAEEERPKSDSQKVTFWTVCPYCFYVHEYPEAFSNLAMKCQTCRKAFQAVEIISPPKMVNDQTYYACWGTSPFGASIEAWNTNNGAGPSNVAGSGEASGAKADVDDNKKVIVEILSSDDEEDEDDRGCKVIAGEDANENAVGSSNEVEIAEMAVDQPAEKYAPDFGIDLDVEIIDGFVLPAVETSLGSGDNDEMDGEVLFERVADYLRSLPDAGAIE